MEPLLIFLKPFIIFLPLGIIFGKIEANRREKQRQREKDELRKEILEELKTEQHKEPRPGSDAHYAAWRAEQTKKNESRE